MREGVATGDVGITDSLFEALSQGHFSVMDYYKMENMIADTKMRQGLSGPSREGGASRG